MFEDLDWRWRRLYNYGGYMEELAVDWISMVSR
jgi:hypothetical protein